MCIWGELMEYFAANKKGNVLFPLVPHASAQLFQMFSLCKFRHGPLCDFFSLFCLIENQLRGESMEINTCEMNTTFGSILNLTSEIQS